VQLPSVDQPPSSFRSPLDAFEQALEHEKEVTAHIHEHYDLAIQEKDYPAKVLLDWFVQEQVEEEKTATEIVERLTMAGEDGAALLMLDKELGERP
jgi:ferritin